MKNIACIATVLLLSGCTDSWRAFAMIESGAATSGAAASYGKIVSQNKEAEKQQTKGEESSNVLDAIKQMLP